jgi:hypothetical protein
LTARALSRHNADKPKAADVMATPEEPPALAYIERTLAESYRKEIDQEENVWRTLPFFAATLALQLAALLQVVTKMPDPTTPLGKASLAFLMLAGVATLVALGFLAVSIFPRRFEYIAREPDLLAYAHDLIAYEANPANQAQPQPVSALLTLKLELADQYAQAADHNRRINARRQKYRSWAGLAALCSVLLTVILVACTSLHYVDGPGNKDRADVIQQGDRAAAAQHERGRNP